MELELELVSPPHTSLTIRVPASTANIGPGFDTLGMGLALYLTLEVDMWKRDSESTSSTTQSPSSEPTVVSLVCQGDYASGISTDPSVNLITTTAAKVATSTSSYFPPPSLSHIRITCFNNIPLGSGLGSSGSAVVAGVLLANHVCVLGLKEEEVLDACLAIEGHPDNVSPSLLGGFIAAYMREQQPISSHCNTTTSHSQPPPTSSSSIIPSVSSPHSNNNSRIGRYIKLRLSPSIRAVAVTPHFPLPTHLARSVLPPHYTRADIIFNMQRIAVLVAALAADVPDPWLVYEAMQDRIHQNYRAHLIPGLPSILALSPASVPGLLGIAISGAGPTVLALATHNFDAIGGKIQELFAGAKSDKGGGIESTYRLLDVDMNGSAVTVVK